MEDAIFSMFTDVFTSVTNFFYVVVGKSGMALTYVGMVAVFFSVRYLIGPLVGRGSDAAASHISKKVGDQ